MNNWAPSKKTITFAIIVTSCFALTYFWGIYYVKTKTSEIRDSYKNVDSDLFKKERMKAIEVMAENNKDAISDLRNFFIKKNDEIKFIEYIERTAKDSNIDFEIKTITINTENTDLPKEDILVDVALRGSWNNIINFLDRMEKGYFGVLIEQIELEARSRDEWFADISFNFYKEL